MIAMFLLFGSATIALFLFYSRKVGSIVNAVTIFTGIKLTIEFVLEPIAYLLNLFVYDFRSIFLINLLSFCGYAMFIVGLLVAKQAANPPRRFAQPNYLVVAWLLLGGAWALYAPVLIEFSYLITEPRRIYELTRTGYGVYTFGSALLSFVAYVVFLMSSKRQAFLFYIPLLVLLALKGTKGQFIILAAIFVIAKVYLEGFRYSLTRSVLYGAIAGTALVYLFAFNYRGEIDNVFVTIAEYSDYNRNGALVLQDETAGYYHGEIMVETLWIPKIPRTVWPNKPKIFGEFRLAVQYYPSWFLQDQGSPSFGVGVYVADFGWWAFLVYPLIQFGCGLLLGYSLNRLIVKPSAFYFVLAVYLSGSNLLASGSGSYLVEHAIIGLGLAALLGLVGVARGHSRTDDATTTLPNGQVAGSAYS
ncbi:MAG TPA: hypothetical protein VF695_02575 [Sphingomonas sp.]|jgi:hypothetical protein